MALKSIPVLSCLCVLLFSLGWVSTTTGQQVNPVQLNEVKLPVRLDQWLLEDLNQASENQRSGCYHLNLASKAWFCVKERALEEWSGVPVRFRLGDQPTVDRLEGK